MTNIDNNNNLYDVPMKANLNLAYDTFYTTNNYLFNQKILIKDYEYKDTSYSDTGICIFDVKKCKPDDKNGKSPYFENTVEYTESSLLESKMDSEKLNLRFF
jgi:hypothetical protein